MSTGFSLGNVDAQNTTVPDIDTSNPQPKNDRTMENHNIKSADAATEAQGCNGKFTGAAANSSADLNTSADKKEKPANASIGIKYVESESFNSLLVYDSDSSYSSETEITHYHWKDRQKSSSSSSSSSSDSDSESDNDANNDDDDEETGDDDENVEDDSEDDNDSDENDVEEDKVQKEMSKPSQNKGAIKKDQRAPISASELGMENLPPVPDLSSLTIDEDESIVHMGNVMGIIDKLVTINSLPNMPAYNLDTVLFIDEGKKPLGVIFDVLGQVTSPIYAVRFNSGEDIKNLQISIGTKVYASRAGKHTQYVFLNELLKQKGTDASWCYDLEVPSEFVDFSDDEDEIHLRSNPHRFGFKRKHSAESHKRFESTMNRRNLLNTKLNRYMDSYKQARQKPRAPQINTNIPHFDPTVPPPTAATSAFSPVPSCWSSYFSNPAAPMPMQQAAPEAFRTPIGQRPIFYTENNNTGPAVLQQQATAARSPMFSNMFLSAYGQMHHMNFFANNTRNDHPGPSHY